jgi:predicted ribosomally synthesized peptide with nif11-like leader
MEQAKSFLEKVKSDAALAEQVKDAKTADEVVKKAAELGY